MNIFFLILLILSSSAAWSSSNRSDAGDNSWPQRYGPIDPTSESSLSSAIKKPQGGAHSGAGPLDVWLRLKLADLYLDQTKYADALTLLEGIEDADPWEFWKQVELAQAYLGLNQFHQTLQLVENFPPEPDVEMNPNQTFYRQLYKEALLTKEEALSHEGKPTQETVARIWALFPDLNHQTGELLSPVSPEVIPGVTVADKVTRLHVLHTKKLYDTVPQLTTPREIASSALPSPEKCRALFEWGNSLRNLKKFPEALDAFSQAVHEKCEGDPLSRALYWKAKLELSLKRTDEAVESYQLFVKKFPNHRLTDDAYYALWKIFEKQNQEGKAKRAEERLFSLPEGDMKSEALWEAAWIEYKKNDFKKTIELLDRIIAGGSSLDESYPRALYWKGRCLERMANAKKTEITAEAKEIYSRLTDDYPFSYYAVLAANRLGITPNIPSIPNPHFEVPSEAKAQEMVITVNLLNRLNLNEEAQNLLDFYSQTEPDSAEKMKPLMAIKWVESGDYNKALSMAADYFGHGITEGVGTPSLAKKSDPMFYALYPLAYSKEVGLAYQRTGLPKGVIEGIMREESLFLPAVRSRAGAVGVMQLMPGTAAIQARSTDLDGGTTSDLTHPKTNILLGSSFFDKMVDSFNGSLPLAIMAYNAGPGNVRKWLGQNGNLPLDEFVEEIPFDETRGYVKRVLRSIQIYGALLKEPQLSRPFFSMNL